VTAITGLFLTTAPDVAHWLPFLATLDRKGIGYAIATCLVPAIIATGAIAATIGVINCKLTFFAVSCSALNSLATGVVHVRGSVSISAGERLAFKTSFWVIALVSFAYLLAIGSILFSMQSLSTSPTKSRTVADGSIYMAVLALFMIMNVAIIAPGLLLLQPFRLNKVVRTEKHAITPRQRFRGTWICPRRFDIYLSPLQPY
jgi:calcium permeable stress-gated cation channel